MKHQIRGSRVQLVCILTKEVDDLKIAGERTEVFTVLRKIQEVFGELKTLWNDFTNCGVRHRQDKATKEITLDQAEYLTKVKTIYHPMLAKGLTTNADASTELHQLYMSRLGAVAYMALTRPDAVVYISALQRFNHAPKVIHVKRLNALTRWLQRHPQRPSLSAAICV